MANIKVDWTKRQNYASDRGCKISARACSWRCGYKKIRESAWSSIQGRLQ